jgi:hypothetical protein
MKKASVTDDEIVAALDLSLSVQQAAYVAGLRTGQIIYRASRSEAVQDAITRMYERVDAIYANEVERTGGNHAKIAEGMGVTERELAGIISGIIARRQKRETPFEPLPMDTPPIPSMPPIKLDSGYLPQSWLEEDNPEQRASRLLEEPQFDNGRTGHSVSIYRAPVTFAYVRRVEIVLDGRWTKLPVFGNIRICIGSESDVPSWSLDQETYLEVEAVRILFSDSDLEYCPPIGPGEAFTIAPE